MDIKYPKVSFAIATYNSERTIEKCLSSIREQEYPSEIEIILADGGSNDKTIVIGKKYKATIINVPKDKQGAEYNKGVAVRNCKNEIISMIDHDNLLPHKNWLKMMVKPLMEDKEIFGSAVMRFTYDKKLTLLDRYFSLIGATDPVAFFFNKSAHQSYLYKNFHLRGNLIIEKDNYYKVSFNLDNLPSLGGNGALIRKKAIDELDYNADRFFHIDIHVDLVKKGLNKYAFVKTGILHLTNNKVIPFLKRRRFYIEKYYFEDFAKRRYSIYEPRKDRLKLIAYIIYSISFIAPLYHSLAGYIKIHDIAWFLHPFMCLSMLLMYGIPTLKEEFRRVILGK